MTSPVGKSPSLDRVLRVPVRVWTEPQKAAIVARMTAALKTPQGTMTLYTHQAIALYELGTHGRLFGGALGVGSGKTLISFLAPVVTGAKRPLLLVPGDLREKTEHDWHALREHWQIPPIRVMSYERLSLSHTGPELAAMAPDLILADEAHYLKNLKAGRVKKLGRHVEAQRPKFCPLTGTMTGKALEEIMHVMEWSLLDWSLLPTTDDHPGGGWKDTLALWSEAIDAPEYPRPPGALKAIPLSLGLTQETDESDQDFVRRGLGERIARTPGVVMAHTTDINAAINVFCHVHPTPPAMEEHWKNARAWVRPDGRELVDALEIMRLRSQLACGFFYRWIEDGPTAWMAARKAWGQKLRAVLDHSRTLDTPAQVQARAEAEAWPEWTTWKAVRGTFTPETEAIWLDPSYVQSALNWAKKHGGVVWSPHVAFGAALAKEGLRYFGDGGLDASGALIDACRDRVVGASAASCATGHNLQHWSSCLVVLPPGGATWWEQAIGRFHRPGQKADEVRVDVFLACSESGKAVRSALDYARRADKIGARQKLCVATIVDMEARGIGAAWNEK